MKKVTTYDFDVLPNKDPSTLDGSDGCQKCIDEDCSLGTSSSAGLDHLKTHCPAAWQMSVSHCGIGFVSGPATMVGLGFRCWVRGLQTCDTRFFDVCSHHYIQRFGLKHGLVLTTKLGQWVDALETNKTRSIAIHKDDACGFSYDEVMAISMIAACQHGECPALRACIYALSQTSDYEKQESAAQDFSDGLIDAGQILDPSSIALPLIAMGECGSSLAH